MAPPLIRRVVRAKSVVRSAGRPCTAVDVMTTGRGAIARGATAHMGPLLRHQEGRADPVGTVSSEMTWSEALLSFGSFPRDKLEAKVVYCRAVIIFTYRYPELINLQVRFLGDDHIFPF